MATEQSTPIQNEAPKKKRSLRSCLSWLVVLAAIAFAWLFCGVFTIQPIGALPQGATLIIWRGSTRPFFDSPDKLCIDIQGGVSLLCRGAALNALKANQIVVSLPYMEWAYLISTGGQQFTK